jgi:hypothetical protein
VGTAAIAFTISEDNRAATESAPQPINAWVIRGFGGRSSLYTWIYRIVVNECYGFLRKKRSKPALWCDSLDDTRALMMEAIAERAPHTLSNRLAKGLHQQDAGACPGRTPLVVYRERGRGFLYSGAVSNDRSKREDDQGQVVSGSSRFRRSRWSVTLSIWLDRQCGPELFGQEIQTRT